MRFRKFIAAIPQALYHPAAGYLVLIASFAVTVIAWNLSIDYSDHRASDRFSFQVEEVESAIQERMDQYALLLQAGVALLDASDDVDREEWKKFVTALDLTHSYPGTQGLGISLMLRPQELADHVRSVREEGFPQYTVRPPGSRPKYSSIVFLEPFDWRNQRAFGFDMYSEKLRRTAMDRASATGLPSISGNVTLVQETDDNVQTGFVMYLPVYEDSPAVRDEVIDRLPRTRAYVYAVLRGGDLMRNLLTEIGDDLSLQIIDAGIGEHSVLFESQNFRMDPANTGLAASRTVDVYGHPWTILVRQDLTSLTALEYWQSTFVGCLGLLVNFLLFYTIQLIGKQRRGADQKQYTHRLEMANGELQKANASYERSNMDLASFAYSASHDMKSPLRAISNLAGFIKTDSSDVLPEKSLKHLDLLLGRTERLNQLLDDMIAYASIGSGDDRKETFCVLELCRSVTGMIDVPAGFTVSLNVEPRTVRSYSVPLKQLLMNLISNAIKHHDRASGAIEVDADWIEDQLVFVVADDGPGIAAPDRHKVFQMFLTLETRDKREGSGMGLAFVKRLVDGNGGRVWIDGFKGSERGTRVHFTWLCESVDAQRSTGRAKADLARV